MIALSLAPDKTHVAVVFDYSVDRVAKIKMVPGRRWSKKDRAWMVPLTLEVTDRLKEVFPKEQLWEAPDLTEFLAGLKRSHTEVVQAKEEPGSRPGLPADLVFASPPPFEHQKTGLALCLWKRNFAIFAEQGTGKSRMMIDLLQYLRPRFLQLGQVGLVVAPLSVTENWKIESKKFGRDLDVVVLTGSSTQKEGQVKTALPGQILVVNYESAWRIENALAELKIGALICDESQRLKTRSTQQAKALVHLGKNAERKYILTGTPMPNGPLELFNQIRFLDSNIFGSSFYGFRDRYAVMGGYKNYIVVGWKNMDELSNKLQGISYRVKKSECLDLPAKLYKEYRLDMSDEQRQVYDKMAKDLVAEIAGQKINVNIALAKIGKLRQITSGFAYRPDGVAAELDKNPKLDQLMELLGPILKEGHKVVIWTLFRHEMEVISRMINNVFPEAGQVGISGEDSNPLHRQHAVNAFQTDYRVKVFLGQQRAGGLGITLTAGDYCIYFSNDFSPEIRMQSEDRLHRIGQVNRVTYIDLIMRNSIDVTIWNLLKKKQELSKGILERKIQEVVYGGSDF